MMGSDEGLAAILALRGLFQGLGLQLGHAGELNCCERDIPESVDLVPRLGDQLGLRTESIPGGVTCLLRLSGAGLRTPAPGLRVAELVQQGDLRRGAVAGARRHRVRRVAVS